MTGPLVWSTLTSAGTWTEAHLAAVAAFVRAHGIEPEDVLATNGNTLAIRRLPHGALQLETWTFDRNDEGAIVACLHCPGCPRATFTARPLACPPPDLPTAWTAHAGAFAAWRQEATTG